MSYKEIETRCHANLEKNGAIIDKNNAESESGAKYRSACARTYEKAKTAAGKYIDLLRSSAATIEAASQNSQCGAFRDPASQKTCFTNAIETVRKAKEAQTKLEAELKKATERVRKYMALNRRTLNRYIDDQRKIGAAIDAATKKAKELTAKGEPGAANAVYTNTIYSGQVATPEGEVVAQDGAASDISGYQSKIPSLVAEQDRAMKEGETFASSADMRAQQHQQQASKYASMEQQLTTQLDQLAPIDATSATSGISDSAKLPENGPVPAERPAQQEIDAATGSGKGARGTGATGGSTTTSASTTNTSPVTSDSSPIAEQAAASSSTPMMSSQAAAAPGMMASSTPMAAASSGVGASDPYAGMNNPVAYNNTPAHQEQYAQDTPKSGNFGEALGTYDPRSKDEESEQVAADPETKVEDAPEQVAAVGGLSGDIGGESSGASSAPGIRGADGKPIRSGFSTAGGGDLQSDRRSLDRDAANKEQFSPDLKSGAVSIAGSEMKSAIASLAEEFGATDLDLDLGELTEEEKAALAPLEGGGVRSLASVKNSGRRTASLSQGSDESILDEQSQPLFSRSRAAHERALMRGNLILGIKKKL